MEMTFKDKPFEVAGKVYTSRLLEIGRAHV